MMTTKLAQNAVKVQLMLPSRSYNVHLNSVEFLIWLLCYKLLYSFLVSAIAIRAIRFSNFQLYTINSAYSIPLSRIFINSE